MPETLELMESDLLLKSYLSTLGLKITKESLTIFEQSLL